MLPYWTHTTFSTTPTPALDSCSSYWLSYQPFDHWSDPFHRLKSPVVESKNEDGFSFFLWLVFFASWCGSKTKCFCYTYEEVLVCMLLFMLGFFFLASQVWWYCCHKNYVGFFGGVMYWEDSQLSECGIMLYLGVSLFLCNLRDRKSVV